MLLPYIKQTHKLRGNSYMKEDINANSHLETENSEFYNFDEERPVGWSAGCVDEAIFYYLDCNYTNMCNLESNEIANNP